MELTTTNMGGKKLLFDRQSYIIKKTGKHTIRWICANRKQFGCNACLTTDIDIQHVIPGSETPHCHDQDPNYTEAVKMRQTIKAQASVSRSKPCQIVKDIQKQHPAEVGAVAGQYDALKQIIQRVRKRGRPKNPISMKDVPIPLPEAYATDVIFDNKNADHRIIIFATKTGITLLGEAEELFMDGTFDMRPSQFAQLYVIRAPLGERTVPVAYAFLPAKDEKTYEAMLDGIEEEIKSKKINLY